MSESYDVLITQFPLFQGFTAHGAQMLIERGQVRELPPGQLLFKEGDPPAVALLVLKGQLEVFVERNGKDLVLMQAPPGKILGELAVLCGIPRSASVRAATPSVALQWSSSEFRRLLLGNAFLGERVFGEALRTLIDKERSLIDSLIAAKTGPQ
jgi:CRP-like cAMP-binding protein